MGGIAYEEMEDSQGEGKVYASRSHDKKVPGN